MNLGSFENKTKYNKKSEENHKIKKLRWFA